MAEWREGREARGEAVVKNCRSLKIKINYYFTRLDDLLTLSFTVWCLILRMYLTNEETES